MARLNTLPIPPLVTGTLDGSELATFVSTHVSVAANVSAAPQDRGVVNIIDTNASTRKLVVIFLLIFIILFLFVFDVLLFFCVCRVTMTIYKLRRLRLVIRPIAN